MRFRCLPAIAVILLTSCRENQKDTVKELEAREADTASANTKQSRHEFESDMDDKLSSLAAKIADGKARVAAAPANANQLLTNEISQQLNQLDQELMSIRMQFEQLRTASDQQFAENKEGLRSRVEAFRADYMRFATGRPR